MPLTNENQRREREYSLMCLIDAQSDENGAFLSRKALADKLKVSEYQVGYSLQCLQKSGFVVVKERFLPNGGRIENSYQLTPMGKRILSYRQ